MFWSRFIEHLRYFTCFYDACWESSFTTGNCLDFFFVTHFLGLVSHSLSVAAVIQRSGPLITTCPLASYSEVPQTACVKNKTGKKKEKSIGFHYLVGQCHWPVNDPVTAAVQGWHGPTLDRCWQEENMLTGTGNTLEHRFALQAAVRGGIVQGHGQAQLGWGGGMWGWTGWGIPSQPPSTVWLSCYHKCFYPPINYSPLDTPKESRLHWLWPRGNSYNLQLHPLLGHSDICKPHLPGFYTTQIYTYRWQYR